MVTAAPVRSHTPRDAWLIVVLYLRICTGPSASTVTSPCPAGYLPLWNGICQDTKNWPPNEQLTREVVTPNYLISKPSIINITTGRQLFVDTFLVQKSYNLKTIFHSARYDDGVNPVLKSTEPWEVVGSELAGGTAKATGVWWQPDKGHYEMFYRCGSHSLCVAYSADAVSWTKPHFDNGFESCRHMTADGGNSTSCNMVVEAGAIGNSVVWLDINAKNASRRYILAASHTHIDLYSSPDGKQFAFETSSGPTEDCSSVYKDDLRNKWVYSIKASGPKSSPGRTRRYWEGHDVIADCHWGSISGAAPVEPGSPVQWMGSDKLDDPNLACGYTPSLVANNTQLYQFDAVAYESVIIGLFSIITGKRCKPPRPFHRGGEQDAVYVGFSRDGFQFQRSPVRASAFLPMSTQLNSWNFQNVRSVAGGFLTFEDKLRFYVEGKSGNCSGIPSCTEGSFDGNTSTGTATLRRDGFASVAPALISAAATLMTEPLFFAYDTTFVFVNVIIKRGGSLQVGLWEKGKKTKQSVAIRGHTDSIKLRVKWENGTLGRWPPPSALPQLHFTLQGAVELYSFWLSHDAECGSSNGPMPGGGGVRGWDRRPNENCNDAR